MARIRELVSSSSLMLLSVVAISILLPVAVAASSSGPALVPAFVWSQLGGVRGEQDVALLDREGTGAGLTSSSSSINYQTLSSDELGEAVKSEILDELDLVLVFMGTKLSSGDISREGGGESAKSADLLKVLNGAMADSSSAVSLPYVRPPTSSSDGARLTDVILKAVLAGLEDDGEESQQQRLGEVVVAGACAVNGGAQKDKTTTRHLRSLEALVKYLAARKLKKSNNVAGGKKTDLLVVCSSSQVDFLKPRSLSEGQLLDQVLWGLDEVNTRYVALYATEPAAAGEKSRPSTKRMKGRLLADVVAAGNTTGNSAADEYCNEVCRTKATILEGLFTAITLLIILISGLCCMGGITSPVRFEQSKDGPQ